MFHYFEVGSIFKWQMKKKKTQKPWQECGLVEFFSDFFFFFFYFGNICVAFFRTVLAIPVLSQIHFKFSTSHFHVGFLKTLLYNISFFSLSLFRFVFLPSRFLPPLHSTATLYECRSFPKSLYISPPLPGPFRPHFLSKCCPFFH